MLNEVAYEGVAGVCNGNNYVELLNTGSTTVDYTGYRLELDAGLASLLTYTFPSGSTLAPGAVVVHCQGSGSFQYGISFEDTMSLKSSTNALLSTTGPMWRPAGSTTYTYQRKATGKFRHFTPTPGNVTSTLSHGISPVLISEVAARPVGGWCNGDDYVELFNLARGPVDISGYLLFDQQGANSTQAYTFPDGSMIAGGQAVVYCQFNTFQFNISLDAVGSSWRSEQVTLRDEVGMLVSYTPITNGWRDYLTLQLDSTTMTYSYKYPSPGRDYKTNTVPVPPPTKAPGMHPTKAPTAQGTSMFHYCQSHISAF